MKRFNEQWKTLLFCIVISILFLTLGSKTSWLYSFHDWFDSNAFFTVGKAMKYGIVPYRDLFEQKGPLLYFLHTLASMISESSFIGVWLFQVVFFTIFLYYNAKICDLYLSKKSKFYLLPLLSFIILMMKSYRYGDSVEEFTLPLIAIGLYHLLYYTKDYRKIPDRIFLLQGVFAGIVLLMKYTLLGFWFGWMSFFFFYLIQQKEYSKGIRAAVLFLGGMALPMIPVILYFLYHHALQDFIDCYFLINMNSYTVSLHGFKWCSWILSTVFHKLVQEPLFSLFIVLGGFFFYRKRTQEATLWGVLNCLLFLILSVYGGGRSYSYYFLIFAPFAIFGLIELFSYLPLPKKATAPGFVIITLLFIMLGFQQNTTDLKRSKEDFAQYQFAKIIAARGKAPTLLNYGFLDGGFYLTTKTVPQLKYFQKTNIPYQKYPANIEEQKKAILQEEINYVVLLFKNKEQIHKVLNQSLFRSYQLISQHTQKVEGKLQTYYLLEKKL